MTDNNKQNQQNQNPSQKKDMNVDKDSGKKNQPNRDESSRNRDSEKSGNY